MYFHYIYIYNLLFLFLIYIENIWHRNYGWTFLWIFNFDGIIRYLGRSNMVTAPFAPIHGSYWHLSRRSYFAWAWFSLEWFGAIRAGLSNMGHYYAGDRIAKTPKKILSYNVVFRRNVNQTLRQKIVAVNRRIVHARNCSSAVHHPDSIRTETYKFAAFQERENAKCLHLCTQCTPIKA